MNCLNDYKQILDDSYIKQEAFYELETNEIKQKVDKLVNEIKYLSYNHQGVFEAFLQYMTELSFYKHALTMKMKVNMIPDAKIPERVYVQMRGSVPVKKGERVWVGQYLGKVEEVCDTEGKLLRHISPKAREAVVKKVVERLKDLQTG